jgi:zinc-ribbon domain
MPEILTESFCERCGTRYTFESVAPRKTKRLGQFKTLGKGVKNWVMSDDSSLDEAMAAARGDEEREATAQQLDAFHSTFNFCMNCRQYTCANCWNAAEGRCLTCSPNLGQDALGAAFPDTAPFQPSPIEVEAWPEADLPGVAAARAVDLDVLLAGNGAIHDQDGYRDESNGATQADEPEFDAAARLAFLAGEAPTGPAEADQADAEPATPEETLADGAPAWPDALEPELVEAVAGPVEAVAEPEPVEAIAEPEPAWIEPVEASIATDQAVAAEPEVAAKPEIAAEPDVEAAPDIDDRAAAAAAKTADLLARFRPGQNIDAELAAYEAQLEAEEALAQAEAPAAPVAAAEALVAAESEPLAAESEPVAAEPEPIAAEPEPVAAEPETVAAEPEPVAEATPAAPEAAPAPQPVAAEPEAAPAPSAPREDVIQQPTWRIFAPEPTPTVEQPTELPRPTSPAGPAPIQASGEPQWPARPDAAESPSMALLANRARASSEAMWAASAREVLGQPADAPVDAPAGIQPCSNCGLSLSANARFCRRCGTRQG